MTKINKKVEDILAKHPNLSQEEAIKIVAEKNERKNQKRIEKTDRINAKRLKNKAVALDSDES